MLAPMPSAYPDVDPSSNSQTQLQRARLPPCAIYVLSEHHPRSSHDLYTRKTKFAIHARVHTHTHKHTSCVQAHVTSILKAIGKQGTTIPRDTVRHYCKNARCLRVTRWAAPSPPSTWLCVCEREGVVADGGLGGRGNPLLHHKSAQRGH